MDEELIAPLQALDLLRSTIKSQAKRIEALEAALRPFTERYVMYSRERLCCVSDIDGTHAPDCQAKAALSGRGER